MSVGVIAFTEALSAEVYDTEIRIKCVAPGLIDTPKLPNLGNETVEDMIGSSPLNRLGDPGKVASLVLWFCSNATAFNTGAAFDTS